MKKTIGLLFTFLLFSVTVSFSQIVEKFEKDDRLLKVEINKAMFELIENTELDSLEKEVLSNIDNVKIFVSLNTLTAIETESIYTNAISLVKTSGYTGLMTIEGDKNAKVFIKRKDDIITDVLMLAKTDEDRLVAMNVLGKIDPDTVSRVVRQFKPQT